MAKARLHTMMLMSYFPYCLVWFFPSGAHVSEVQALTFPLERGIVQPHRLTVCGRREKGLPP